MEVFEREVYFSHTLLTLLSGWWLGSLAIQNSDGSNSPPFTQALGAMMVVIGFLWVALAIFDGLIVFRVCWNTQWERGMKLRACGV